VIAVLIALTSLCEPSHGSRAMFVTTDSTSTVTVCLSTRYRVSSYHAVLAWDTAAATLGLIDRPQRGIFAERTDVPGRVDFAGSRASGFDRGPVLRVGLHARDAQPVSRLMIIEVVTVDGRRLVASHGPDIESMAPDTIALGSTMKVTIHGRHFSPDSNRIEFGPARVGPLPSSDHGTVIRFVVPAVLPAIGEAPPFRLGPATYPVRITTPTASSNIVPFTLVERVP
jgi:hypothetical protein